MGHRRRVRDLFTLCSLGLVAVACGGQGLDGQQYRDGEARYRIGELEPGWARLRVRNNDLAWANGESGAVIQVNATCDPFQDVPLTSLTGHLLIGFTDREERSRRRVALDGREALRTHVAARLDGVPRELVLYVLKKDTCTYDFALIAPAGDAFRRLEPGFDRFVTGFTTEGSS